MGTSGYARVVLVGRMAMVPMASFTSRTFSPVKSGTRPGMRARETFTTTSATGTRPSGTYPTSPKLSRTWTTLITMTTTTALPMPWTTLPTGSRPLLPVEVSLRKVAGPKLIQPQAALLTLTMSPN